jgi:hypothetical protein
VHNFEHVFDFTQKPRPPDPRPLSRRTYGDAFRFPKDFPEWPEGIEPAEPDILST